MTQSVIYIFISFVFGFLIAWVIRSISLFNKSKELKQAQGLLESERLIKETLRKENALAFRLKEKTELELGEKLLNYQQMIKQMDRDILLLQKNNEETEKLFRETHPELFDLKMQLIEANNNINRLKAQLQEVSKNSHH